MLPHPSLNHIQDILVRLLSTNLFTICIGIMIVYPCIHYPTNRHIGLSTTTIWNLRNLICMTNYNDLRSLSKFHCWYIHSIWLFTCIWKGKSQSVYEIYVWTSNNVKFLAPCPFYNASAIIHQMYILVVCNLTFHSISISKSKTQAQSILTSMIFMSFNVKVWCSILQVFMFIACNHAFFMETFTHSPTLISNKVHNVQLKFSSPHCLLDNAPCNLLSSYDISLQHTSHSLQCLPIIEEFHTQLMTDRACSQYSWMVTHCREFHSPWTCAPWSQLQKPYVRLPAPCRKCHRLLPGVRGSIQ